MNPTITIIPGEIQGWQAMIGDIYRSPRFKNPFRFGPFGPEAYEAAALQLMQWPEGLLDMKPAWDVLPHYGHPLTIKLLVKAARRLEAVSGVRGIIRTNGFYRPPGQTWGEGEYADEDGAIDSTDEWGHWRLAIDIAAGATAASFTVEREVVIATLKEAGLSQPLLADGEYWHYVPSAKERDRWARRYI